jgi:hypothetical protein
MSVLPHKLVSTIYNMSGHVVSDTASYEFIGEVILKINVV